MPTDPSPPSRPTTALCGVLAALSTPNLHADFQPLSDKVALLAISAHPDDEGIFFGGAMPYYSQVRGLPTAMISMTSGDYSLPPEVREQELRNAAAVYGVPYEPLFPRFRDYWFGTDPEGADRTFDIWNDGIPDNGDTSQGRVKAAVYIATQIRRLRPEVVISHDIDGEYGHGNHRATGLASIDAWSIASNPGIILVDEQGLPLEPWTPGKLYLHLYDEQPGHQSKLFHLGWEASFPELGGATPRHIANRGLREHVTQGTQKVSTWYPPGPDGEGYDGHDSERWGLAATRVGIDPETPGFAGDFYYGDFFANIDLTPFASILADANADGMIGVADLDIMLSSFGQPVPRGSVLSGDADGSGVVDVGDLQLLLAGWNSGEAIPTISVPEPAACFSVLAAGGLLTVRRRR